MKMKTQQPKTCGTLAIQAHLKKQEKSQINNLTLHLKQLEKEEMNQYNFTNWATKLDQYF